MYVCSCLVTEIMIKFVLLVNKQGVSQYYEYVSVEEMVTTEKEG